MNDLWEITFGGGYQATSRGQSSCKNHIYLKRRMKFILSLLSVVSLVAAQTCSFSDPTNGNQYNNLNQATGNTDVQISHNDWAFYLNLCTPVKATACGNNAGICQTWNNGEGHASLGAANTLTFSSLMGSCGIEHENHDWPGFDLAEPVPAASAAACCTLCKSQWSQANAYVFSPNTRNCWCKNVDTDVEPGPAGDRVYGMIGIISLLEESYMYM